MDEAREKAKKYGTCTVQLPFDPNLLAQSIEHLFHFSFLINKDDAGIKVLKDEDRKKACDNGHKKVRCYCSTKAVYCFVEHGTMEGDGGGLWIRVE